MKPLAHNGHLRPVRRIVQGQHAMSALFIVVVAVQSVISGATSPELLGKSVEIASTFCRPCYAGTAGPCQHSNGVCTGFLNDVDGVCPKGSSTCVCPACSDGSNSPCHDIFDPSLCSPYSDANNQRCGWETFECHVDVPTVPDEASGVCQPCRGTYNLGTTLDAVEFPCQHELTGICFPFMGDTLTCPVGTKECTSFRADADPVTGTIREVCKNFGVDSCDGLCFDVASGYCTPFFPGTAMCPVGTVLCASSGGGVDTAIETECPVNGEWLSLSYQGYSDEYADGYYYDGYSVSSSVSDPSVDVPSLTVILFDAVSFESHPCNDAFDVSSSQDSITTCLPIVIHTPALTGKADDDYYGDDDDGEVLLFTITVQLPSSVYNALPDNTAVSLQTLEEPDAHRSLRATQHSKRRMLVNPESSRTNGCSSLSFDAESGTVTATGCKPNSQYTVTLHARQLGGEGGIGSGTLGAGTGSFNSGAGPTPKSSSSKSMSLEVKIIVSVACSVVGVLMVCAGLYQYCTRRAQQRREEAELRAETRSPRNKKSSPSHKQPSMNKVVPYPPNGGGDNAMTSPKQQMVVVTSPPGTRSPQHNRKSGTTRSPQHVSRPHGPGTLHPKHKHHKKKHSPNSQDQHSTDTSSNNYNTVHAAVNTAGTGEELDPVQRALLMAQQQPHSQPHSGGYVIRVASNRQMVAPSPRLGQLTQQPSIRSISPRTAVTVITSPTGRASPRSFLASPRFQSTLLDGPRRSPVPADVY